MNGRTIVLGIGVGIVIGAVVGLIGGMLNLPVAVRGGLTGALVVVGFTVLRRMAASSRPVATRFVSYWSNLDVLVPGHRARIVEPALRAANVCIPDEGHLSILLSRRLVASVRHELGAVEGLPGYGAPLAGLRHAA